MAWPIQVKSVERGQIPATGTASKKLGTRDGLIWKIPGTSLRQVDLNFKAGFEGNKNDTIDVEIRRGESVSNSEKVKGFQTKTPINKSFTLSAHPGMVIVKLVTVKSGGMFGGVLEKFWPGMPGVSGKTAIELNTQTHALPQPDTGGGGGTTPGQTVQAGTGGGSNSWIFLGMGLLASAAILLMD